MTQSVKNGKNKMKNSKNKRFTHNKKTKNRMKIVGGGKEEQDLYINEIFEGIKKCVF
jgi:hypothetical protein